MTLLHHYNTILTRMLLNLFENEELYVVCKWALCHLPIISSGQCQVNIADRAVRTLDSDSQGRVVHQ